MQRKAKETFDDSNGSGTGSGPSAGRNRDLRITQIIRAAQQTFQEDGYAAFTTRGVAGRVGITLGNLQYYFRTKEDLLGAALQAHMQQTLQDYRAIAGRQGVGAAQRCSALADQIIRDIHETDLARFMFEVWAFSRHEPYATELVDETYTECRRLFTYLLSEIHPTLAIEECLARASVLIAQASGMMIFARHGGDSDKDYAEFVRVTRRSVKLIIESPAQALDHNASSCRSSHHRKDAGDRAQTLTSGPGAPLQQELFNLSNVKTRQDAYYRPTIQGKRREVKINEIISTAANLLASEGYANFTQVRVAKELGILPSALQNYFATRDDLLRSTIDAMMKSYLDRYAEMGKPNGKPALERLCEIVEDAFEEAQNSKICRFSFEMFALAQHSDITRELVKRLYSTYRTIYVGLVREIDASATARECLARATLIAAQMEGAATLMFGAQKQAPEVFRVFELMRAMTIRIAHGDFATKDPT
ncbi:TetR/AcrR family transcriptional regulator [Paraburkholderia sp. LEh10]|uniref:TetR/AcrR family transcriptional regulator n=1 Tax=Paraburkholderia sp. LEh10 TaxID=2821353 RepID=UPI001AE7FC51|nr:TetR/AcrR family transcriptional regulator [Paraburkholderia sp. LEh10]MBP0592672.1 TetR/AcrR family transcriptional regulator [Paraburkholderia sp. LEh10]